MTTEQQTLAPGPAVPAAHPFRPFRAAMIFVVGALLTLIIPMAEHPVVYAGAMAIGFLVLAPMWYRWQHGQFDAFETLHVIGFRYFVFPQGTEGWTQALWGRTRAGWAVPLAHTETPGVTVRVIDDQDLEKTVVTGSDGRFVAEGVGDEIGPVVMRSTQCPEDASPLDPPAVGHHRSQRQG